MDASKYVEYLKSSARITPGELQRRYLGYVFAYISRRVPSEADAEDLALLPRRLDPGAHDRDWTERELGELKEADCLNRDHEH